MARGGHVSLGKQGEDVACLELARRGYAILARRYRTRAGEIDIIARDRDTLVFIEVKARRSTRYGAPAEAVDWRKQQRLLGMAAHYLHATRQTGCRCRFDVVSVWYLAGQDGVRVEVIQGAFEAS